MEATTSRSAASNYLVRLASKSSSSDSENEIESICSLQGKETVSPKDTSDLSTPSEEEDRGPFYFEIGSRRRILEYDLVDVDDAPEVPFSSTSEDSESDVGEIARLGAVAAAVSHEWDNGLDADTSSTCSTSPTSNSDVDPGLPRADYNAFWNCVQCKEVNENCNYQHCAKCRVMRKNFFPPREKRKRKRTARRTPEPAAAMKRPRVDEDTPKRAPVDQDTPKRAPVDEDTPESGVDSGYQGSQPADTADEVDGAVPDTDPAAPDTDPAAPDTDPAAPDTDPAAPDTDPAAPDTAAVDLCGICCVNPRNGLFIHGTTAHSNFCCNKCAFKTWKSIGCCPLCRKKVRQVVKLL